MMWLLRLCRRNADGQERRTVTVYLVSRNVVNRVERSRDPSKDAEEAIDDEICDINI
jgi:hypothetical protein